MKSFISQICALSVFCGIALCLTPEGSVKRMTSLCCMLLIMISALSAFRSFDYAAYSLELARYRDLGRDLSSKATDGGQRYERMLIEQECADYIQRQAASVGITETNVQVAARWDTAGVWVPESVRLRGSFTNDQRNRLQELIAAELGIDEMHQEWIEDEA